MQIVRVLIPQIALIPLEYNATKNYNIGDLVQVPLRNKNITGIIVEIKCKNNSRKLRLIDEANNFPAAINIQMLEFMKKVAQYYLSDIGTVTKLVLPVNINEKPIKIHNHIYEHDIKLAPLTHEQQEAIDLFQKKIKPTVIKGITGSGKTEVYFHAIFSIMLQHKQSLVLLPEIALSQHIIQRFQKTFGFEPAIWNSSITKSKKKQILRGIISGDVRVVIGARSALFLPYKDLGLIVVDEEHDASYKQNSGITYNARDMAVQRGVIEQCKIMLVSATPCIETIHNTNIGKYEIIHLKKRFNTARLPSIKIINMKEEKLAYNQWISNTAMYAIKEKIKQQQQVLIFLNRRGYAPLMLCKHCGYKAHCRSCSSNMVVHKKLQKMECHHCGANSKIYTSCPDCGSQDSLTLCGPGIERIYEEIIQKAPTAKAAMISMEQNDKPLEMQKLLNSMEEGAIDILIGTQIITKGYHFPKLTLVVVVDADLSLIGGELRTTERTFQLLHQVSGRAGRASDHGHVLIQTYYPEHKVIKSLAQHTDDMFFAEELNTRRDANMPPFSKIAEITISGIKQDQTLQMAQTFVSSAPKSNARILGPAEALMFRLSDRYRYKILVLVDKKFNLQKYLSLWKQNCTTPYRYRIKIDIDPY